MDRSCRIETPAFIRRRKNQSKTRDIWKRFLNYGIRNCNPLAFAYGGKGANGFVQIQFNLPVPAITSATSVCLGSSVTLSVSAPLSGVTYVWYNNTTQIGTGTSIAVTPSATTSYTVEARYSYNNTGTVTIPSTANTNTGSKYFYNRSAARTITVSTPPTAPTGIKKSANSCENLTTTLTASGGNVGSGCTYEWRAGSCTSGTVLGTGASITVTPTSTTTYYVRRIGTSPCGSVVTECASITIADCSCAKDGTVLFLEDFGGNDASDPVTGPVLPAGTTQLTYGGYQGGQYIITKGTLNDKNSNWANFQTGTTGYYIAVNAKGDGAQFYEMQIDGLCDDKKLLFSARIGNMVMTDIVHPSSVGIIQQFAYMKVYFLYRRIALLFCGLYPRTGCFFLFYRLFYFFAGNVKFFFG